jgi:TonB-dependent starch-binding outer membrane protein SusC
MMCNKSTFSKMMPGFMAFLCLMISFMSVQAQDRVIQGSVKDLEDGSPLPGVNVIVKGTKQGTVTDFNGKYTLSVPKSATTLVFSYIG